LSAAESVHRAKDQTWIDGRFQDDCLNQKVFDDNEGDSTHQWKKNDKQRSEAIIANDSTTTGLE
jgi:hypothetical protein